ncbi:hypothetical protein BDV93DRAFT_610879 [Ceratobasidium sp. AG-I]|nr:hypothetical protein BDV93DRAFT_610879 [Ceratobasidium sp. AG-I]
MLWTWPADATSPWDQQVPPVAPPAQPITVANTAYELFLTTGDIEAADKAILLYQSLFDELENDLTIPEIDKVQKARVAGKLSAVLAQRFEHLGDVDDMKQAIEVQAKAAALAFTDPSNQALQTESMTGLGRVLTLQFEHTGDAVDAELAVETLNNALTDLPEDSTARPVVLGDIAKAYFARYQHFDNEADLDTAVDNCQAAINALPLHVSERPSLSNILGKALLARFERSQDLGDINSAAVHLQAAINPLNTASPDQPKRLSDYGDALLARFQVQGNPGDLQESINTQTQALALLDSKNPARSVVTGSLASAYYARYKHLGHTISDLDEAIEYFKTAVELTLFSSPACPGVTDQLATAFMSKYQVTLDTDILNYAIVLHQQAVALTPGNSRHRLERLKHLGNSAIAVFTEALDIIGGDVNHPDYEFIISEFGRIGHIL